MALLKAGNLLRKLSARHQAVLVELMTRSLGGYLDMWFEGEALRGVLGLQGVIGNFAEPYQAGTAYVRGGAADQVIATIDEYVPNFGSSVVGGQIKSPLDIERDLGIKPCNQY